MKTGIELIQEERERQIKKWGTTDTHDTNHENGELVKAALFALTFDKMFKQKGFEQYESKTYEKSARHCLIIAGALIASELDRLTVEGQTIS